MMSLGMKVVLVLWGQPDVLGTFREGMGQVLDTAVSRVCLLCLCRTCKYPVFGVPSISTCASRSWLVHLKANALLGSQFFRLFVGNCFKSWVILLFKLSYEDSFFSGSFVQKWVSNFSACVPICWWKLFYWISSDLWSHLGFLPVCHLPRQCTAFCRLQQEQLLLRSQRAFFWWYFHML